MGAEGDDMRDGWLIPPSDVPFYQDPVTIVCAIALVAILTTSVLFYITDQHPGQITRWLAQLITWLGFDGLTESDEVPPLVAE